jgi:PAS domain S-box-containing protein
MLPRNPSVAARYIFTILAVTFATLLRYALNPVLDLRAPYILYFPTVVFCAWFGGLWPGLLSAALGSLVAWFVFFPPQYSLTVTDPTAPAQVIIFSLASVFISLLAENLHQSRRQTEKSEAKEQEQRERFRVTLASIGDAVIATDVMGRVNFMNPIAESLTGWKDAEASGRPLTEVFKIVNEQTRAQAENPALRAIKEGAIFGLANHTLLIAKDGTEIPIDDSGAPIKTAEGKMLGAALIFRDVTERKLAEDALHAKDAELEAIINQTPFMLTRCGRDLRYRFISQAYAGMVGRRREEVVGKPIVEIMGEEGFKTILPHVENVLEGRRVEYESGVHFQGVGERFLHVIYTPETDERGSVTGWVASILDITERRRAEEAVRQQAALLDLSAEAVFAWELDGPITYWNRGAEALYGFTREQAIGQKSHQLLRTIHSISFADFRAQLLRQGEITTELVHTARNGRAVIVESRHQLVVKSDRRHLVLETNRDITERKRAEEERSRLLVSERAAREQAEAASRAKDEFVAMISHEIRSPLNSILGWVQMLRTGKFDSDETRRALETIERNAKSQVQLIEDLLDISRVITGKLRLNVRPVDPAQVVGRPWTRSARLPKPRAFNFRCSLWRPAV